MNKTFMVAIATIAGGIFTSCSNNLEDAEKALGTGYLNISIGQDNSIVTTKTTTEPTTITADNASGYYIQIDNETEKSYSNVIGTAIPLSVGSHTVKAYNKSATEAENGSPFAWDAPYYYGTQSVTIETGKGTDCTVACTIANSRVSLSIASDIASVLSDLKIEIQDSNNHSLQLYPNPAGTLCYIKAGTAAKLVLTAKNTNSGSALNSITTILAENGVVANKEYAVNYALSKTGTGNITITVDDSMETVTLNTVTINPNDVQSSSNSNQSSES
jgi:hypothetical protein